MTNHSKTRDKIYTRKNIESPMCAFCAKKLESAFVGIPNQVYGGGTIKLVFCYGSTKFDLFLDSTEFDGFICDDCALGCTKNMDRVGFGIPISMDIVEGDEISER